MSSLKDKICGAKEVSAPPKGTGSAPKVGAVAKKSRKNKKSK